MRTHAAGVAGGRQSFRVARSLREEHARPTVAAALAWAPPEALAFYRDERARREEAAAWLASQQAQMAGDQATQAAQRATEQAQQAAQLASQAAAAAAQQAIQSATSPP